MRKRYAFFVMAGVAAAFLVGHTVRGELDFDLSPQGIRSWFLAFDWKGPLIFLCLMTFRQFLFLPSAILLSVGGLSFGFGLGTLLGGVGIILSGVMKFTIARTIGFRLGSAEQGVRFQRHRKRLEAAGPLLVGVATAHPIGPMAPIHWAAGFSSMPLAAFALAVIVGGPIRAAAYSLLGSTLVDHDSIYLYAASTALVALVLAPLAHPRLRRWILAPREDTQPQS